MRNKIMVWSLSGMMLLGMAASAAAQVESDVYVDLSALDSLDAGESPSINTLPLFPEVKKAPAQAKAAVRKARPAKRKAVKSKAKINVEVVKPEIAMPKAPVKTGEDDLFKSAPAEVKDTASAAPVVPVKVQTEELPEPEVVSANVVTDSVSVSEETASVTAQPAPIPFVDDGKPVQVVDVEPASDPLSVSKPSEMPVAERTSANTANIPINEAAAQVEAPAQDADVNAPVSAGPVSRQLTYNSEAADMNAEQQLQVDRIIASFSDANVNKIAIYAYNLDDGVDAFKKKRISLNRAVDVRSYLLKKGYKNFSIKVINVGPGSDKANVVEIEELK